MITITGATGQLGRLTVAALLDRGVPGGEIVAAVRNPDKAADFAAVGVQVRYANYDEPASLTTAFADADRLLLISSSEVGARIEQHRNVVEAARAAGVSLIAYTSILNADTTSVLLAKDHKATEALIRESGLPFALLRNGWYLENYTATLPMVLQHGAIFGSAGEGRVAPATRADFAAATAAVLTGEIEGEAVYELGGDQAFTMAELAAEISRQSGKEVVYRDLPVEEYTQVLVNAGLPAPAAAVLADSDLGIARGDLTTDSGHLRKLAGRPTTTMPEAIAAALKS